MSEERTQQRELRWHSPLALHEMRALLGEAQRRAPQRSRRRTKAVRALPQQLLEDPQTKPKPETWNYQEWEDRERCRRAANEARARYWREGRPPTPTWNGTRISGLWEDHSSAYVIPRPKPSIIWKPTISERLQRILLATRWTQDQLGEALGCLGATIGNHIHYRLREGRSSQMQKPLRKRLAKLERMLHKTLTYYALWRLEMDRVEQVLKEHQTAPEKQLPRGWRFERKE